MSSRPVPVGELQKLVSALCDGMIGAGELSRLEDLVCNDPEARWYYIRYMHLHANLSRYAQVGTHGGPASRLGRMVADSGSPEEQAEFAASIDGNESAKGFQGDRRGAGLIRRRRRWVPLLAAAAVILAAAGLAGWLFPGQTGSATTFATTWEQLSAARFIGFTAEIHRGGRRVEVMEAVLLQPDRMRQDLPGGEARIVDFTKGKMLTIHPAEKRAEIEILEGISPRDGRPLENFVDNFRENIERMRTHRQLNERYLGKQEIEGRLAEGFEMRKQTEVQRLWVDIETGMPVRLKVADPDSPDNYFVIDDFRFDIELDESLFSVAPPPGYTVEYKDAAPSDAPDSRTDPGPL
jgi:hypothetical protein